jgi:hypothetical protein
MTKKRIQVKDNELIDRLNRNVAAAALKEHGITIGNQNAEGWDVGTHGLIQKELPEEQFTETPTDPPAEWESERTVDIPNGEVVIDPTLKTDDTYRGFVNGADDAIEWDKHDSIEEAKESRKNVAINPIDREVLNKAGEDILYKRFLSNPQWLSALKRALADVDEIEDTRLRTPVEEPKKEQVNHPDHYNDYDVEVIEMMERVFGHEAVINFCRLNAFKYRMRAGHKDGNSLEQDLKKERWYLDYIKNHS